MLTEDVGRRGRSGRAGALKKDVIFLRLTLRRSPLLRSLLSWLALRCRANALWRLSVLLRRRSHYTRNSSILAKRLVPRRTSDRRTGSKRSSRTFHQGSIASVGGDITGGLPRVEEVLKTFTEEYRVISKSDGIVAEIEEPLREKIMSSRRPKDR